MNKQFILVAGLLAVVSGLVSGCPDLFPKGPTLDSFALPDSLGDGTGQPALGKGPGESCSIDLECRIGLTCVDKKCTRGGDLPAETPCLVSGDCGPGLVCGFQTKTEEKDGKETTTLDLGAGKSCKPEGAGEDWDICTTDVDCKKGYYCKLISFTGTCQPEGDSDMGQNCETTADCMAGLYCGQDKRCGIIGLQIPLFLGAQCSAPPGDEVAPEALFEVPRGTQALADYYRLPFPNDIRIKNGKLDMEGHPLPGPGAVGFDVVERAIGAMEEDLTAFGTNPVVFFRFSHAFALSSIKSGSAADGANIFLVDITDESQPGYGKHQSISWVANTGRGLYICQNYIGIYVPWARPLRGGRVYAAIVTKGFKAAAAEDGGELRDYTRSGDFDALLSNSAPTDTDMKVAWDKYAPLRTYLDATGYSGALGISRDSILTAAVFTTYDPVARMAKFKELMDTIDLPTVSGLVKCGQGVVSPCDDGLTGEEHKRGCIGSEDSRFTEWQGKVKIPTFQEGQRPYIEPADGGGVDFDALGRPVVKGFEEVCFSITVPKGTAPAGGWPIVLYGHGTGGNYRSHVMEGIAGELADYDVWNDSTQTFDRPMGMAVVGWDQVLHGPRIGPAPLDPDSLVFNFRNPRAALGNFYQASGETMVLAKALSTAPAMNLLEGSTPFPLDSTKVCFFGHSQGGISGPLAIPFVEEISSMVISGTGGGLVESLLRKESPVDIRDGVIVALQDENIGRTHPALALLQNYYDPVDPINYGSLLFVEPYDAHRVRTLQPLGRFDTFTAERTMMSLAAVMRAEVAPAPSTSENDFEPIGGTKEVSLPRTVNGGLTVEYIPKSGNDGHFVIFDDADAKRHYKSFLGTSALDGVPVVVE